MRPLRPAGDAAPDPPAGRPLATGTRRRLRRSRSPAVARRRAVRRDLTVASPRRRQPHCCRASTRAAGRGGARGRPDGRRTRSRRGGRRFPAHLDTRHGDEGTGGTSRSATGPQPSYTFDRDRAHAGRWPRATGTPRTTSGRSRGTPRPSAQPRAGGRTHAGRAGTERRCLAGGLAARGRPIRLHLPARAATSSTTGRRARPRRRAARVSCDVGLIRCYRGRVRGSLLLTRRGEALS